MVPLLMGQATFVVRLIPIFSFTVTLSWWRSLSYRNQSIDWSENQWTGFYMIGTSVMKELKQIFFSIKEKGNDSWCNWDFSHSSTSSTIENPKANFKFLLNLVLHFQFNLVFMETPVKSSVGITFRSSFQEAFCKKKLFTFI